MSGRGEKKKLRVIHCHGCDRAVLVQFSDNCPRCGHLNGELQTVHNHKCHACDRWVTEWTPSAVGHINREVEQAS